jgi:very-short-patch-repair endonuclease
MPFDIAARIEAWRTQLLDTTKRNRLINFKSGRTGGITLIHPAPDVIWHRLVTTDSGLTFAWQRDLVACPPEPADSGGEYLALFEPAGGASQDTAPVLLEQCRLSPRLRPDHLLSDLDDRKLAARLTRLALNARQSLAEQGVATLFVAFGFLRWFESPESQVEVRSPLLLVPVGLERDNIEAPWKLRAEDEDVLPNHSLAQMLAHDFRLKLPVPDGDAPDADAPGWRTDYFAEVRHCVRDLPRWEVLDEAALGTFAFQKIAMWEDLGRNRDSIAAHDLCRAVAGDPSVSLTAPTDLPRAEQLDRESHPAQTFQILDADSSQHEAITAAKRGASLVLDGPPGTGKSQTIANVIAEMLAARKTVLFVSEKAAALEVVQRRLQDRGLGDFCLACHSHKANKRDVVAELGRCLGLLPEEVRDPGEELQRLYETRLRLNDYVRELHAPRPPLGESVYRVQGELARLSRLGSKSRCPVPQVLKRDAAYLRRVTDLLARLPDCRGVIADPRRHPWRGCRRTVYSLTLRDDVRHHFGRLASCLGRTAEATASLNALGLCESRPTQGQWLGSLERCRTILSCPQLPAAWFAGDPGNAAEAAIRLDTLSQEYRRAEASLPEFTPGAVGLALADTAGAPGTFPAEFVPVLRPGDTVKSLLHRLPLLSDALGELRRRAEAVDQAVQRVGRLLGTSLPSPHLAAVTRLSEMVDLVTGLGPVRPSWWDAARRQELQGVVTRYQEEARRSGEARAELSRRLSPRAFARESAALAARASWYQSFLTRLLPTWWSVKAEVSGWYTGGAPGTAVLVDDMTRLAAYHRQNDYCREVREQYANDLWAHADGNPDWGGSLEALKSVDRLTELSAIPPTLQTALSSKDGPDRPALAAARTELDERAAALRRGLEASGRECGLSELTEGPSGQMRVTVRELIEWLGARLETVARLATLLRRVGRLLPEGGDVSAEALPSRLQRLHDAVTLRAQIAGVVGLVWPGQTPPRGAEAQDWSALRDLANALLGLLSKWTGPLRAPEVRALTTAEVRSRMAEAVRLAEKACADGIDESWQFLAGVFDLNQSVSTGLTIEATALADLRSWLSERAADAERLQEWTQFCDVEREVRLAGVAKILDEVLSAQVKPEEAAESFRARFLGLWLDAVHESVPALGQFTTESHERLIERFRELDRRAVASAAARVRAVQLSRSDRPRPVACDPPGSSELGTLLREANKKRRHLPLRKLFAAVPTLLLRLKPCVMMSPLAVSTYLDAPDIRFDLVIFDEASQVRPHDAVCALYRGRQLIVAGDQKQLPPTSFFDRALADDGDADEEGAGGLEDYESILDVCCTLGLPRRRLRWHYRSRREGLIAFSNREIYGNELVTFPSVHDVAGNPAVAFEYVPDGRWKAGTAGGYNATEARRTAELVLAHFRSNPGESLGVIAFSQRQQMRIVDELESLRKGNPELEDFFREGQDEPFFVKNLENVQGDERDVIFLGVGYGPDEIGRVAMRFGPLNLQGGERRLNVAVTRARHRMTVVSSMHAHDIDLSRTGAFGVKLLRAYLDYAEGGTAAVGETITGEGTHDLGDTFEQAVYEELTRRELSVFPKVGCSDFRIDLALSDTKPPGRYLLGVECDGRTYQSSATARDRDRLRQEALTSLGWRICRVWSTDWLRNREAQVGRVQAALEKAEREGVPLPATSPDRSPEGPAKVQTTKGAPASAPPTQPQTPVYEAIDDVPAKVLRETLCRLLATFGATDEDDLIRAAARQLGFARTGSLIRARVKDCVDALIAAGLVCRMGDGRFQLPPEA